jgi:hypothetical protein
MANTNEIEDFDDFSIDENNLLAEDDGSYLEDEDYYEGDYPDEKDGERSDNTIVVDELENIDFSSLTGDFKSSLKKLTKQTKKNEEKINKIIAPSNRTVIVENSPFAKQKAFIEQTQGKFNSKTKKTTPKKKVVNSLKLHKDWGVKKFANIQSKGRKAITNVIVPRDRKTIIEGVNRFILSDNCGAVDLKSIGYCNGKKLKEMVFIINNEGNINYTVEFFNPSTPMDYYQATSQNINDKISVAGQNVNGVQYTDVMWHMMSNPTRIINSKIVITAPNDTILFAQRDFNFGITQKDLRAYTDTEPINIPQLLDKFQFQSNILAFNFQNELNRPYVPDGMDILRYTILAGCTVSIAFYYEQKMLKKYFYKDLRDNKHIL